MAHGLRLLIVERTGVGTTAMQPQTRQTGSPPGFRSPRGAGSVKKLVKPPIRVSACRSAADIFGTLRGHAQLGDTGMAIKPSTRELEHRQDAAPREPMPAWFRGLL